MNSNTPHSRALRAATAAARTRAVVDAGGRRLTVLLPAASAEKLARLEQQYGSATSALVAALDCLAAIESAPS